MWYFNITLNQKRIYINSGNYVMKGGLTFTPEHPLRIELNILNQMSDNVIYLHKTKINYKYFYNIFIKSEIIETLVVLGEEVLDNYLGLYNYLEELYTIYKNDEDNYPIYILYNKITLNYIFTGNILDNYKLLEFKKLGEIYTGSLDIIIINTILLSDKIKLEIQEDDGLLDNFIYLMDTRYNTIFVKLKQKLSYIKRINIVESYNKRFKSERYSREETQRLIYYNEICNLLLEN